MKRMRFLYLSAGTAAWLKREAEGLGFLRLPVSTLIKGIAGGAVRVTRGRQWPVCGRLIIPPPAVADFSVLITAATAAGLKAVAAELGAHRCPEGGPSGCALLDALAGGWAVMATAPPPVAVQDRRLPGEW